MTKTSEYCCGDDSPGNWLPEIHRDWLAKQPGAGMEAAA